MGCRLSFWLMLLFCSNLAQAVGLVSFNPQGSIKKASQIQARFDTDMINFGTGRVPSPFKVDCPARGDGRWLDAMPTALMKPLSGSGARAMMIDTMNTFGVDSFQGRLAATMQGSTETTFYVLAVYFGAVGIRHGRHALACGLTADVAGISASIAVAYWFYG
mgnify:CR=1 FL=1